MHGVGGTLFSFVSNGECTAVPVTVSSLELEDDFSEDDEVVDVFDVDDVDDVDDDESDLELSEVEVLDVFPLLQLSELWRLRGASECTLFLLVGSSLPSTLGCIPLLEISKGAADAEKYSECVDSYLSFYQNFVHKMYMCTYLLFFQPYYKMFRFPEAQVGYLREIFVSDIILC